MLTTEQKSQFRSTIFKHLDGLVTAPTAFTLNNSGMLQHLLKKQNAGIDELASEFKANEGYLNVALRVLASQGWLTMTIKPAENEVYYSTNEISEKAFSLIPVYKDVVKFLEYALRFPLEPVGLDAFLYLNKIFTKFDSGFGLTNPDSDDLEQQVLTHIEGVIAGPIIVMLGQNGFFHKYFMEARFRAQEYHKDPESFGKILDFLLRLGWFTKKNDTYQFTEKGLFFAKRASAYGVTVSYLPTLTKLDELIFGNPDILRTDSPDEAEKHVNREMNVWGSGGAHSTYFKVIDQIIIELFNRPLEEQPKGILDMGCGNGAFIQHIFDVIEHQTIRGKRLDEYPLLLVGADYNKAALKVTRANLIKADIWAKVVWGDIGKPEILANDLREDYDIALDELLNVRTFLDHNRVWSEPENLNLDRSSSTGAYAFRGKRLANHMVEASFLEHLIKWKPYVERFGLLIIELHTLEPELTAKNLGKTAATAYDATHGYSDQYILEMDVYENLIEKAGLTPDPRYKARFPDSEIATVSVNLLKGKT